MNDERKPIQVLTVAGSDSGGGAGVQADLKAFAAMGVHGCSVITSVTAQNSTAVTSIHVVPPEEVAAQLDAVFADFTIAAVKTGLVPSPAVADVVAAAMERRPEIPLVVDPVLRATSGADLQRDGSARAMLQRLVPRAALITPNAAEAALLTGMPVEKPGDFPVAARALLERGCRWVLITGGDLPGDRAFDLLAGADESFEFSEPKVDTPHTHGSGCALASAVAARIALGEEIPTAVKHAKQFITEAIGHPTRAGKGHGPIDPLFRLAPWGPPA